jgi:Domain of unknown function (DUF1508)
VRSLLRVTSSLQQPVDQVKSSPNPKGSSPNGGDGLKKVGHIKPSPWPTQVLEESSSTNPLLGQIAEAHAADGEIIEGHKSKAAAKNGIKSVQTNVPGSTIVDKTG